MFLIPNGRGVEAYVVVAVQLHILAHLLVLIHYSPHIIE